MWCYASPLLHPDPCYALCSLVMAHTDVMLCQPHVKLCAHWWLHTLMWCYTQPHVKLCAHWWLHTLMWCYASPLLHPHLLRSVVVVVVSTPSRAWARTGSQTPARGPPSFSLHTSSSAATPTGSVHKSQTVSVVGMSGQLKRCNESWFGSLQSGQFAAGWLAGSILCRWVMRRGDLFVLSWESLRRVEWGKVSSFLSMSGGGLFNSLLMGLLLRWSWTIVVWMVFMFRFIVFSSIACVGSGSMFRVYWLLLNIVFFF